MQFSYQTLTSTFKRFNHSLNERDLGLSPSTARNVWAQIIAGRNFSAVAADANDHDYVRALPISAATIQAKLRVRNRDVSLRAASDIFAEAVREDLPELSNGMFELVRLMDGTEHMCLMGTASGSMKLGIRDAKKAGYLQVSNNFFTTIDELEVAWIRSSNDLVAATVNFLAGVSTEQLREIIAASCRLANEKADQVFAQYYRVRIESCILAVAEQILKTFDPATAKEWEVGFDEVRDLVFEVFERDRRKDEHNWLSPECALGEATIDHLGARLRDALKWMCDQANEGQEVDSPVESLMQTARLAMRKILGVQTS